MAPFSLLTELHRIEADHGRVRETRWGARTLDCDLIQYGDPGSDWEVLSDDPELTLPHPRAAERAFVLAPWLSLDSEARLRVGNGLVPVSELLQRIESENGEAEAAGGVRPGPEWSPSW
jgi:dihydroneopterin aldolase/2-amino-4-hydroxy-6-hydroxymethyldihydropteridine diphosphokinase